jgi:hypothetical protein
MQLKIWRRRRWIGFEELAAGEGVELVFFFWPLDLALASALAAGTSAGGSLGCL